MKKDFSTIGASIEKSLARPHSQTAATPQEQAQRRAEGRTQGRKGCAAIRFNVAFTDDNAAYIRTMAKISGQTMTQFINTCIADHREAHAEEWQKTELFLQEISGKS